MSMNYWGAEMIKGRMLSRRGFTLIELMIGLAVTTVIVGAGFGVLIATQKATTSSQQIVDAQQGTRLAMELISRDIKLAGFGPWNAAIPVGGCAVGANPAPLVPVDDNPAGPDDGPDGIRMVVPVTNTQQAIGQPWTLAANTIAAGANMGFNFVPLNPSVVTALTNAGLGTSSTAISINGTFAATVAGIQANGLNLLTPAPQDLGFGSGAQVYLLQCVDYRIGSTAAACGGTNPPCLLRGTVDAAGALLNQVAVADGVEDIQFSYACDGCTGGTSGSDGAIDDVDGNGAFQNADFQTNQPWNLSPMLPQAIRLVQVSIVGRQTARAADQGFGEGNAAGANVGTGWASPTYLNPGDHNHALGLFAPNDVTTPGALNPPYGSVRRRIHTKVIQARNLGML